MEIKFVKLTEFAVTPTRSTPDSAGLDLRSAYDYEINVGGRVMVKTDLAIKVPEKTYGRIAPRSGLAVKYGIDVLAGVVDRDYTGNVCIVLINHGENVFKIRRGDRVAQLICECVTYPTAVEYNHLDETERGSHGFGSSGGN